MPSGNDPLRLLLATIRAALAWFDASGVDRVLIGGVAVALVGRPRITRDVDAVVLVNPGDEASFFRLAAQFGFQPRIEGALEFSTQSRVLLMHDVKNRIDVDVSLGVLRASAYLL